MQSYNARFRSPSISFAVEEEKKYVDSREKKGKKRAKSSANNGGGKARRALPPKKSLCLGGAGDRRSGLSGKKKSVFAHFAAPSARGAATVRNRSLEVKGAGEGGKVLPRSSKETKRPIGGGYGWRKKGKY